MLQFVPGCRRGRLLNSWSTRLRSFLVTCQFTVSIALLVCTGVVWGQAYYAKHTDLGFKPEGLAVIRGVGRESAKQSREVLEQEVRKIAGVTAVTLSSDVPGDSSDNNGVILAPWLDSAEPVVLGELEVDYDFFDTFKIQTIAGRTFSPDRAQDDATGLDPDKGIVRPFSIVINAKAVKRLGFVTPEQAIGKMVRVGMGEHVEVPTEIIGVIADFHYKSVREEIRPTFYLRRMEKFYELTVRYAGAAGPGLMNKLEQVWRRHVPELPFRGEYLDQVLAAQYQREDALATMFGAFSALAILVACLGLYGLAAFTASRRTREIGIRKVMGASVGDIVRLLVWQFSRPALLANALAWPISWYAMREWLAGFQYRIDLRRSLTYHPESLSPETCSLEA